MSKQFNSRKLRSTNRQLIAEQVDIIISKSAKLVIENIVIKKNVIVDGDQEDNMLIDSHVDLELNSINANNVVKRGKKRRRKSKISVKSNALSSKCLTSFIKPKTISSENIRREYLKEYVYTLF